MTQPGGKLGPVTIGGSEVYGNSAQGVFETMADIQSTAKGCAEWIDALATGTGQPPNFAHDHRGGVWGRTLGVGHSLPMIQASGFANIFESKTFINVPDATSPTGEAFATIGENGGYQLADLYVYHNAAAGTFSFDLEVSTWSNGVWSVPSKQAVAFVSPGGASAQWTQCAAPVQLPAGLVRLEFYSTTIASWHYTSIVIPQR